MIYQSSNVFTNLPVNSDPYQFTVKDANGCTAFAYNAPVLTNSNCALRISGYDYNSLIFGCGSTAGYIDIITVVGGTSPYTYSLDGVNYQSSPDFTNLPGSNYQVYVKDATGLIFIEGFLIADECSMSISYISTNAGCHQSNGTITVTAQNGNPPYQYTIDGIHYQTSNVFTGLPAGNYFITVMDLYGTTVSTSAAITSNCPSVSATATIADCGQSDGTITATGSGGTSPYKFSIDGINYQPGTLFSNLPSGNYTVYVMDNLGFTATTTVMVPNNCLSLTVTAANAYCANGTGSITVSASNGTAPYQYSIDAIHFQPTGQFTALPAGAYTVTVKDANSQTATATATIVFFPPPTSTVMITPATCAATDGSITINASGGTSPYTYSLTGSNFTSGNTFTNISAGANLLPTVKDANGCTATTSLVMTKDCPPTVTATGANSLCGLANASITATGANGTAPYQYSIDGIDFQTSPVFGNLSAGTYTITLKDANGLLTTTSVTVASTAGPQLTATTTPATCLGKDGAITASNIGGLPPVQFSLGGAAYQPGGQFTGLDTGTQIVFLEDANGCIVSQTVDVPLNNNLTVDAGNDISICQGTGSPLNAASNGQSFSWSPAAGLNSSTQLDPMASPQSTTTYYMTATSGICSNTDSVTVLVHPAPIANAGTAIAVCYGKSIQLNGSGGLSYAWSPATYLDDQGTADPTVTNPTNSITYSLTVTDQYGCRSLQPATVTLTVTPPAQLFAGDDTSMLVGQPLPLNAVDINNSGFTGYSWSPATGLTDPSIPDPIATVTGNIVYTVVATTADGCQGTDSITIKVYTVSDIFVPNAFTPNGDGHNDLLRPICIGIRDFRYFAVYNRWGQCVFQSANSAAGWNGTINGQLQPTGTFVWMAAGIDYRGMLIQRKGTTILIR